MVFDFIYLLHFVFLVVSFSIPLWNRKYLKYGIYLPLLISAGWIVFDGCPVTNLQANLGGDTFFRNVVGNIVPTITNQQADNILFFIYLAITIISYKKLCG